MYKLILISIDVILINSVKINIDFYTFCLFSLVPEMVDKVVHDVQHGRGDVAEGDYYYFWSLLDELCL